MSEQSTPETDALSFRFIDGAGVECEAVPSEFVRLLERERDEAREAAAKWESSSDKLADTLRTDAYQYADYILNHYDRNSHMDKLCLAKSLVENGYGSKAAEIKALSEKEKAIRERDEARALLEQSKVHICDFHRDIMGNCIACQVEETK